MRQQAERVSYVVSAPPVPLSTDGLTDLLVYIPCVVLYASIRVNNDDTRHAARVWENSQHNGCLSVCVCYLYYSFPH